MNERRKATAFSWATYHGSHDAEVQYDFGAGMFSITDLEVYSKVCACAQAIRYQQLFEIPPFGDEYPAWETVFVEAYKAAYTQRKAEIEEKNALALKVPATEEEHTDV